MIPESNDSSILVSADVYSVGGENAQCKFFLEAPVEVQHVL